MTEHHHHHHDHVHHAPRPWYTQLHKNWVTWVALGLMLLAMAAYFLSDNEALRPGGGRMQNPVPAAP